MRFVVVNSSSTCLSQSASMYFKLLMHVQVCCFYFASSQLFNPKNSIISLSNQPNLTNDLQTFKLKMIKSDYDWTIIFLKKINVNIWLNVKNAHYFLQLT